MNFCYSIQVLGDWGEESDEDICYADFQKTNSIVVRTHDFGKVNYKRSLISEEGNITESCRQLSNQETMNPWKQKNIMLPCFEEFLWTP